MVGVTRRRRERPSKLSNCFNEKLRKPFRFFKIILPSTLEEHRLRIPEKFVKKFSSQLSTVATLTIPTGLSWKIKLRKSAENKLYFTQGWPEFMDHNDIKYGYFLVFEYEGNSHFKVHIFDLSCSEIDYPMEYDHQKLPRNRNGNVNVREEQKIEEDKARKEVDRAATMSKKRCKKPSFTITVRKNSISGVCYLHIPKSFSDEHMKGKVYEFVKLEGDDGREWLAGCYVYKDHFRLIGPGWRKFNQEKGWSEGQIYTFVLVDKCDGVTFKVSKDRT